MPTYNPNILSTFDDTESEGDTQPPAPVTHVSGKVQRSSTVSRLSSVFTRMRAPTDTHSTSGDLVTFDVSAAMPMQRAREVLCCPGPNERARFSRIGLLHIAVVSLACVTLVASTVLSRVHGVYGRVAYCPPDASFSPAYTNQATKATIAAAASSPNLQLSSSLDVPLSPAPPTFVPTSPPARRSAAAFAHPHKHHPSTGHPATATPSLHTPTPTATVPDVSQTPTTTPWGRICSVDAAEQTEFVAFASFICIAFVLYASIAAVATEKRPLLVVGLAALALVSALGGFAAAPRLDDDSYVRGVLVGLLIVEAVVCVTAAVTGFLTADRFGWRMHFKGLAKAEHVDTYKAQQRIDSWLKVDALLCGIVMSFAGGYRTYHDEVVALSLVLALATFVASLVTAYLVPALSSRPSVRLYAVPACVVVVTTVVVLLSVALDEIVSPSHEIFRDLQCSPQLLTACTCEYGEGGVQLCCSMLSACHKAKGLALLADVRYVLLPVVAVLRTATVFVLIYGALRRDALAEVAKIRFAYRKRPIFTVAPSGAPPTVGVTAAPPVALTGHFGEAGGGFDGWTTALSPPQYADGAAAGVDGNNARSPSAMLLSRLEQQHRTPPNIPPQATIHTQLPGGPGAAASAHYFGAPDSTGGTLLFSATSAQSFSGPPQMGGRSLSPSSVLPHPPALKALPAPNDVESSFRSPSVSTSAPPGSPHGAAAPLHFSTSGGGDGLGVGQSPSASHPPAAHPSGSPHPSDPHLPGSLPSP